MLRFEGPVERTLNRWAATDVELGGQTIRRGELVIAILNAADRDPERFPEPDRLDVRRAGREHLAFGRGSHYCLGAPLARLEAEIALETLFRPPARPPARRGRAGARVAPDARLPPRGRAAGRLVASASGSTTSMRPSTSRTITLVADAAAPPRSGPPDLAGDAHLPSGLQSDRDDRAAADERLRADRRPAPLRPPEEERRLAELERRAQGDRDPAPRLLEHEDGEEERAAREEDHRHRMPGCASR